MKGRAWTYVSTFVAATTILALGAVYGVLVARLLGPIARGKLAVLIYFPTLIGCFGPMGVPQALTYILSRSPGAAAEYVTAGIRIALGLSVISCCCFFLLSPFLLSGSNQGLASAVKWVCIGAPAMVMNPHFYAIQRGLGQFGRVNAFMVTSAVGNLLSLGVLWLSGYVSPLSLVSALLLVQTIVALANLGALRELMWMGTVRPGVYWLCLKQGFYFLPPVMAFLAFTTADRAVLIRTTTLEEIGYYTVAMALASPLISVALELFGNVVFVEVAKQTGEHSTADLVVRRFHLAQIILVSGALVVSLLAGPLVYLMFGVKFASAIPVVRLLAWAMCARGLSVGLDHFLRAKNCPWPGTAANSVGLAALVCSAWFWSRGAFSFALLQLSAELAVLTVMIILSTRFFGTRASHWWGLKPSGVRVLRQSVVAVWRAQHRAKVA